MMGSDDFIRSMYVTYSIKKLVSFLSCKLLKSFPWIEFLDFFKITICYFYVKSLLYS